MMIDSSVLVAGFCSGHPHFARSHALLKSLKPGDAVATTHSLAETFASITRLPIAPRPGVLDAQMYIESLGPLLRWVELTGDHYQRALQRVVARQFPGARIYDALVVAAAEALKERLVITWNMKHFLPLVENNNLIIRTPDDA